MLLFLLLNPFLANIYCIASIFSVSICAATAVICTILLLVVVFGFDLYIIPDNKSTSAQYIALSLLSFLVSICVAASTVIIVIMSSLQSSVVDVVNVVNVVDVAAVTIVHDDDDDDDDDEMNII